MCIWHTLRLCFRIALRFTWDTQAEIRGVMSVLRCQRIGTAVAILLRLFQDTLVSVVTSSHSGTTMATLLHSFGKVHGDLSAAPSKILTDSFRECFWCSLETQDRDEHSMRISLSGVLCVLSCGCFRVHMCQV